MNNDEVFQILQRLEGKMDGVTFQVAALTEKARARPCLDHERRIRCLERGWWKAMGIWGAVLVVLTLFKDKIPWLAK